MGGCMEQVTQGSKADERLRFFVRYPIRPHAKLQQPAAFAIRAETTTKQVLIVVCISECLFYIWEAWFLNYTCILQSATTAYRA